MSKYSKSEQEWLESKFGSLTIVSKLSTEKRVNMVQDKLLVKCHCGVLFETYANSLIAGTKSCGCSRRKDIVGERFGFGVVESFSHSYKHATNKRDIRTVWNIRCDCGNLYQAKSGDLSSGHKQSCGCKRNSFVFETCEQKVSNWWRKVSKNCRKLEFSIDLEYCLFLLEEQNNLCNLSGVEINIENGTASLDRIDSSKGYIEGNVQWVHRIVNFMKTSIPQDQFLEFCKLISIKQNNLN